MALGCTENSNAGTCSTPWFAAGAGAPHLALRRQNQSDASWGNASRPFQHELWGVYPVLGGGFCLLGELEKFVGVSETRFGDITVLADEITVQVKGDPYEVVTVTAAVPQGAHRHQVLRDEDTTHPELNGDSDNSSCSSSMWETDTDFGGHDLHAYADVRTAAACCANCSATKGCHAFTWAGAKPAAGPPFFCWLKTSDVGRGTLAGHTSGRLGVPAPPAPPPPPPPPSAPRYSCAAGICTAVPGGGSFNTSNCDRQCKPAPAPPPPGPLGTDLALRVRTVVLPASGTLSLSFARVLH
jgi:hypothetical protein